jgi:hypothetical protein
MSLSAVALTNTSLHPAGYPTTVSVLKVISKKTHVVWFARKMLFIILDRELKYLKTAAV